MCLYPKLFTNRKYTKTKKNGGNVPIPPDERVTIVPIGCQKCTECRKQKGRNWSIRLQEELRTDRTAQFVTLTFSNESIRALVLDKNMPPVDGYDLDNEIATLATRRFLERWRKRYKRSVKHWLVTELGSGNSKIGHKGTENIHIHGIIFNDQQPKRTKYQNKAEHKEILQQHLQGIWQYGYVYIGDYVNEQTVNYCVKYSTKPDPVHPNYMPKILCSAGIGNNYMKRFDASTNKFKKNGQTDETYYTRTGTRIALPTYYRNHIYTEEEREQLWLQKLDRQERWVLGKRIDISRGPERYYKHLITARQKNKRLGYEVDTSWQQITYEQQRRKLNMAKRLQANIQNTTFT